MAFELSSKRTRLYSLWPSFLRIRNLSLLPGVNRTGFLGVSVVGVTLLFARLRDGDSTRFQIPVAIRSPALRTAVSC